MSSAPVQFTNEKKVRDVQFRSFYKIDRNLFCHLVVTLKLAVKDAVYFMAFWLWLEREVVVDLSLIRRLLDSTSQLVQDLADETLACLRCLESEVFSLPSLKDPKQLRQFVNRNITLKYLHENRKLALKGISEMLNQVCLRAFDDIVQRLPGGSGSRGIKAYDAYSRSTAGNQQAAAAGSGLPVNPWQQQAAGSGFPVNPWQQQAVVPRNPGALAGPVVEYLPVSVMQHQLYGEDPEVKSNFYWTMESLMSEEPAGLHNLEAWRIFMTFSKEYPITEEEIWDFFRITFGENIIESVYMPQVPEEVQVLYAVVVARSVWEANTVVGFGSSTYEINGKECEVTRKFPKN